MTEATQTPGTANADREIVQERVFDAPVALVFKALTDPAYLPKWFGPKGFTNSVHEIDVRPGGVWRFVMHAPDGTDFDNVIQYVEIVENERMVYDQGSAVDEAPHFRVTVTFEDLGGKTRLCMRSVFPTAEAVEAVKKFGAVELGQQTLDRLANLLATSAQSFSISRSFDAPRELVFKAWTEAERLAQWWGPKGFDLEVVSLEVRPGGVFHYRMSNAQGAEMWGRFFYAAVAAPERLIYLSSFSTPEGGVARAPFSEDFPLLVYNVLTFTEENGKTTVSLSSSPIDGTPAEQAFFTGMHASMQQGFGGTFDQLDAYLAKTK